MTPEQAKARRQSVLWCMLGVASPILTVLLIALTGPWGQDVTELPFRRAECERIVTAIQSGTLHPDSRGVVVLPSRWKHVTKDGKVYVTRDAHGVSDILFPTFMAGGWFSDVSNFGGDVYATRPLTGLSGGIETDSIQINAPVLAAPLMSRFGDWTSGLADAYIEEKGDAHWYEVGTDND